MAAPITIPAPQIKPVRDGIIGLPPKSPRGLRAPRRLRTPTVFEVPVFGGGGGAALPPDAGGGSTSGDARVVQMNVQIAAANTEVVDATGNITVGARRALVDGLDITDLSDSLLSFLDPTDSIRFTVDSNGNYTDAELITSFDISAKVVGLMNFPTAYFLAKESHPIARAGWTGEGKGLPDQWLIEEGGVWFVVDASDKLLVTSEHAEPPNVTASDLLSQDWLVPPGCRVNISKKDDFPSDKTSMVVPTQFDVFNPPCQV